MANITNFPAMPTIGNSTPATVPMSVTYAVAVNGTGDFNANLEVTVDGVNFFSPSSMVTQSASNRLVAWQLVNFPVRGMRLNVISNEGVISGSVINL